ncbi:alpha/beta fold hydrolase [Ferrimonas balearica]|uniref:alpha/beta hydrolase n=1 Tax=Ferrimonas balearica TaxID=44012 RepID=UPI001C98E2E3|nr:alpha/beta fold hydrolase [Ferrimonas balearica]
MRRKVIGVSKHLGLAVFYGSLGTVVAALALGVFWLNSKPDLALWHTTVLKQEYRADNGDATFSDYLQREERLFSELEQRVYRRTDRLPLEPFNRYFHNSLSDPALWPRNWNRSFEWPNPDAEFGVLLIHGMSDSPYYMAPLARHFADRAHVVGLRLPGHGTVPSMLTTLEWQDLQSATRLASDYLAQQVGDKPLLLVGFSTGAALGLNHTLSRLAEGQAPQFDAMVFLSPAMGLAPIAQGAWWQNRIGQWLGLEKLAWESLALEYHPFKYGSFAVNAGDVVYQLIQANQALIGALSPEQIATMPPVLTFNSVIDETVDTQALFESLYLTLGKPEDELVLFDINRTWLDFRLLTQDPIEDYTLFLDASQTRFRTTIVENIGPGQPEVQAREIQSGEAMPLGIAWPREVHSLSHVALTIPEADPLLGPHRDRERRHIHLGGQAVRGERGMLAIPSDELLRQKWNPFYPYLIERMDEWANKVVTHDSPEKSFTEMPEK